MFPLCEQILQLVIEDNLMEEVDNLLRSSNPRCVRQPIPMHLF